MVEIRQAERIGHGIELVIRQLRHQILCKDERIEIRRIERQTEPLGRRRQEADIEIGIMRTQHAPAAEGQKFRQHLRNGRCIRHHGVRDAGKVDDLLRMERPGFTKAWNVSTTCPSRRITAPISVISSC